MKTSLVKSSAIAAVAVLALGVGNAQSKEFYKMSTIALSTPFAINTTFVKIIQK